MSQNALLQVEDLKTYFYADDHIIKAVDGIDLHIKKGETLALVGESGCGKSITSLSVMGLVPQPKGKIAGGSIQFDGKELLKLSENQMTKVRGNDIAMIFQEPMTSLNPVLKIGDQIMEPLIEHKKISKEEARKRAIELLKLVGFPRAEQIIDEYPHQLSGGMRQRVMIAMGMTCNPKLLIADEPTTALDVTIQAQILELMKSLKNKFETSILLITHDLGVVAEMADRVMVMYAGKIVEEGDVETIYENPQHPYTKGLLASIPSLDTEKERLYSIQGNVPSPGNMPTGCRFAPRCEYVTELCHQSVPPLVETGPGHRVRCILAEEVAG